MDASKELSQDFEDPLLDTYHVDGALLPEEIKAFRPFRRVFQPKVRKNNESLSSIPN